MMNKKLLKNSLEQEASDGEDKDNTDALLPSLADDGLHLGYCFPISERGETSHVAGHKRFIHYTSPIPKTRLTKTLLSDNVCDERRLQLQVNKLLHERRKQSAKLRQQQTAFENKQNAKKRLWSRTDELQLNRLNLPQIHLEQKKIKSASLEEVYKKPMHIKTAEFTVPLLPVMVGEDVQKIIEYNKQIFITRLPTVERLATRQMKRYNGYKGTHFMEENQAVQDKRFQRLSDALSERKSASKPIRQKKPLYMTRSLTFL